MASEPSLRRLYLLRHAQAAWPTPGQRDFDRHLDTAGLDGAHRVGKAISRAGFHVARVLCSPALRCRQTLDALVAECSDVSDIRFVDDLYSGTGATYLALIAENAGNGPLLVVGHNPSIDAIFRTIIGSEADNAVPAGYPPGALAAIDLTEAGGNHIAGTLAGWIDPDGTRR